MLIKVEEDDHGHATLLVHGEPDIIMELVKAVTLLLAADADKTILPDSDDEDLASSS